MRSLPAYERGAILGKASSVLNRRRTEIGRTLAGEAGKPIRDALTEVDRAATTFHAASEEARRLGGDVIPLDLPPHGKGRIAILRRFRWTRRAISPFNFRSTSRRKKLAPAIAAGNAIVLKPATKTPLSACIWPARSRNPACRRRWASCRCRASLAIAS
jgi:glyceraldehyde-3-phosphate dehydrogenase (NADP+)